MRQTESTITNRRPRRYQSPSVIFPITTAVIAALSLPLWIWISVVGIASPTGIGLETPLKLAAGFAVMFTVFVWSEVVPVKVEVRRETLMVSLSELPLVIGLLVLPWYLVIATHVISGIAVYIFRKDGWRNSFLNLALISAETGTALGAMVVVHAITGEAATGLLPVAVGVLAGALMSSLIVGVAYQQLGPAEPLGHVVSRAAFSAGFVIIVSLALFTLWNSGTAGPPLVAALTVVMVAIYLTFRAMMTKHANLNQMYDIVKAVGIAREDTSRWPEMLEMVRQHHNAAIAALYLETGFGDVRPVADHLVALAVNPEGTQALPAIPTTDALLEQARTGGPARASVDEANSPEIAESLRIRGASDVMVVVLRSNDEIRGYLEVRNRLSRWGEFSDEDAEFLETMSGHLATALENVRLMSNLRDEAYRDSVTGLRSRTGMAVDAELALTLGKLGSVVLIQLGTISAVNNALGYQHGEELLVAAGKRIRNLNPATRRVARLESDLFAILMEPMEEEILTRQVRDVLNSVGAAFSLAGVDVEAEPHAGIAFVQPNANPALEGVALFQRAEMALLAGRNRNESLEIYRPTMGETYRRRFNLVTQFRQAVESGHISVYYQPQVTLRNQELRGVEALVRWQHPEFGMVNPAEFVKAIEATGSIDILFDHVLNTCLKQSNLWLGRGLRIPVAVNVSVRNLTADFPDRVAAALATHQVPGELLTLELTESNMMADPEQSLPILSALHAQGIKIAVDDFGTGYSSLAYLRRLPVDELKIDRSFIQGMSTALGDLAIVRSIIDLGHSLNLQVIAEGVEEESSREVLRSMRCDGMQGFLFSRPQPIDRFEAWLAARTVRSVHESTEAPVLRVVG
ncbi:putative bifunctional diguanylate cyclase/phosphodiesterase [Nakamurella antarctica]|nr:EAL domain-containing protein [Nakamurella antarctica]